MSQICPVFCAHPIQCQCQCPIWQAFCSTAVWLLLLLSLALPGLGCYCHCHQTSRGSQKKRQKASPPLPPFSPLHACRRPPGTCAATALWRCTSPDAARRYSYHKSVMVLAPFYSMMSRMRQPGLQAVRRGNCWALSAFPPDIYPLAVGTSYSSQQTMFRNSHPASMDSDRPRPKRDTMRLYTM